MISIKYKNKIRRRKNTHALEVSCGKCKTPAAIYQKGGKGNLIKMQVPRIIEAEFDFLKAEGHAYCPKCGSLLARKGSYADNDTYWIVRGKVNIKRLDNYRY